MNDKSDLNVVGNEFLDACDLDELGDSAFAFYHEGGSLVEAVAASQLHVVLDEQLFKGDSFLFEHGSGNLALGAGLGGKQHYAALGACGVFLGLLGEELTSNGGMVDVVNQTILVLLRFTVVPVLNRAVVAGDAAVYLGLLAALGAGEVLACDVAVGTAYRIGGRHGVIGKLVVLSNLAILSSFLALNVPML